MQEHGLKISELVTLFNLEVLNRGSDYDTESHRHYHGLEPSRPPVS